MRMCLFFTPVLNIGKNLWKQFFFFFLPLFNTGKPLLRYKTDLKTDCMRVAQFSKKINTEFTLETFQQYFPIKRHWNERERDRPGRASANETDEWSHARTHTSSPQRFRASWLEGNLPKGGSSVDFERERERELKKEGGKNGGKSGMARGKFEKSRAISREFFRGTYSKSRNPIKLDHLPRGTLELQPSVSVGDKPPFLWLP